MDLLAVKNEQVRAITVRCKPKDEDCEQLQNLAEYSAFRRIYIFTQTPSFPFIEYMKREDIADNVEFWSIESLAHNLFKLHPFIMAEIALGFTDLSTECVGIVNTLEEIYIRGKEITAKEHRKLAESVQHSRYPQHTLWSLKDHASSLHKSFSILKRTFESMIYIDFTLTQQVEILKSVGETLEQIYDNIASRLHSDLEDLLEEFPSHSLKVASATRRRSNWLWMFNYRNIITAFYPHRLIESFSELKNRENLSEQFQIRYENRKGGTLSRRISRLKKASSQGIGGIAWLFSALERFAMGIEAFVDDVYESLSEADFDQRWSDWRSISAKREMEEIDDETSPMAGSRIRLPGFLGFGDNEEAIGELLKIRWLLTNKKEKIECPECGSELGLASSDGALLLECKNNDCNYTYH